MIEIMKSQQPDADPTLLRSRLNAELEKIRAGYPGFLSVSAAAEKKLTDGSHIEDSATSIRIAQEQFFGGRQSSNPITRQLQAEMEAGSLSPVRAELLGQLMVMEWKMTVHALSQ